jgi:hypothetical protein
MKKRSMKKAGFNVRAAVAAAVMAVVFCIPQIGMAMVEIDSTRIGGWHNGMSNVAEKDIQSKEQRASENTILSKLVFSDEKNLYDILKKLTHQEK